MIPEESGCTLKHQIKLSRLVSGIGGTINPSEGNRHIICDITRKKLTTHVTLKGKSYRETNRTFEHVI